MNEAIIGGIDLGGCIEEVQQDGWATVTNRWGQRHLFEISEEPLEPFDQCESVTWTADSGAADHVAPKSVLSKLHMRETKASREGLMYATASGQRICNQGSER